MASAVVMVRPTALAADDDLSEVCCRLIVEGQDAAGEVLPERASYTVGEVGLASSAGRRATPYRSSAVVTAVR